MTEYGTWDNILRKMINNDTTEENDNPWRYNDPNKIADRINMDYDVKMRKLKDKYF